MPKLQNIKKVLVIGSGPIIIGQAAEFDYAGTQACRSLKEEGLEVVLVNSNPATIVTDVHIADRVYIEPVNVEFLESVIKRERPDSLLATLGGQVGLNLAIDLEEKGILREYNVQLLGTQIYSIKRAEDRELFKETMEKINQPIPESAIVETMAAAKEFARKVGFPLIVRPAYTLGGTGGGIAESEDELDEIVNKGLKYSLIGQALIERSVAGWKEIEFEVLRDAADNCITVCSMENLDPVGVHTGDSIVAAPAQTLSDREVQLLRQASIDIVRELGVRGGCNVQLALDPNSERYYVIEVNPRVSRSSALASKATGYPIAKVSSKIAIGYNLDEIQNAVTKKTTAHIQLDENGEFVRNPEEDLVKVAVVERHQGTGNVACGFLKGYGIKEGAVALSVAHDSHNIIVVGVSDEEMEFAVNSLIEQEGGIVLVKDGKVIEQMPMPIAGLMSDQSGEWVDEKLTSIHEKAYTELGICGEVEPVMTLCFMSLAVIPEIKLTDMGLFDVTTFSFIPVEISR